MITDWNDAYANAPYIENAADYPPRWASLAAVFREEMESSGRARTGIAYGMAERQQLDLFLPGAVPFGLAVFIHGGYWHKFDRSIWSHLARGPLERGWAVAMPSYTLGPQASVAMITQEIGKAVECAASLVEGPVRLSGHSAGGHLATRMACTNSPLPDAVRQRIGHIVSISGVHDLRPLEKTDMAKTIFRNPGEAAAESPALLQPVEGTSVTCIVGSREKPEFLRQNALLANIWTGLGARTRPVVLEGDHHFSVIEGLADAASPLTDALVGQTPR
jgi:acetyl esterase/lipase